MTKTNQYKLNLVRNCGVYPETEARVTSKIDLKSSVKVVKGDTRLQPDVFYFTEQSTLWVEGKPFKGEEKIVSKSYVLDPVEITDDIVTTVNGLKITNNEKIEIIYSNDF